MTREEAILWFENTIPQHCCECPKEYDFSCSGSDAKRCVAYKMAISALREPPVVHGYNKQPQGMFECSVCGWMDWDTVLADGRFNFCPNCGARMDGE